MGIPGRAACSRTRTKYCARCALRASALEVGCVEAGLCPAWTRQSLGGAVDLFHHQRDVRAITDMLPNRCEHTSTVHHRELRQSPETDAFPAANFSPLFDDIWPRSDLRKCTPNGKIQR